MTSFKTVTFCHWPCNAFIFLVMIYECVENLNPKYFNDFLCPKGLSCQWWDSNRLHQTKFNTVTFGYRSFSYYGAKVWNTLSPGTKMPILSAYEINLKKWCLQMHWCKVLDYIWWYLCSYYYLINFMCLCWFSCQLYNGSFLMCTTITFNKCLLSRHFVVFVFIHCLRLSWMLISRFLCSILLCSYVWMCVCAHVCLVYFIPAGQ